MIWHRPQHARGGPMNPAPCIEILLTLQEMTSPEPPHVFQDFWPCAYQAIDD